MGEGSTGHSSSLLVGRFVVGWHSCAGGCIGLHVGATAGAVSIPVAVPVAVAMAPAPFALALVVATVNEGYNCLVVQAVSCIVAWGPAQETIHA